MVAMGSWIVGCCLLAQGAEEGGRTKLQPPRFTPRRTAPAATLDEAPSEPRTRTKPSQEDDSTNAIYGTPRRAPAHETPEHSPAGRETEPDEERPMAHVGAGPARLRPPELLAEALTTPHGARIKGRKLALVDLFTLVQDRSRQVKAVQAYWKLAYEQAQYHYALDARERLRGWGESHERGSAVVTSVLAAADAAVDDAEVNVIKAGTELADLLGAQQGAALPWAVDRPHVGDYRTEYEKLVSSGAGVPPRLRLIHRTLPIGRKAIDLHGAAVVAAQHAVETTADDFRQGNADFLTLVAALDRFTAQRRAFLNSVLRYNDDIAEYAFTVAPGVTQSEALAQMLIKSPARSMRGTQRTESATDSTAEAPMGEAPGSEQMEEGGAASGRTFLDESGDRAPRERSSQEGGSRGRAPRDPAPRDSRPGDRVPREAAPFAAPIFESAPADDNSQNRDPSGSEALDETPDSSRLGRHAPEEGLTRTTAAGARMQLTAHDKSHGGLYQGLLNAAPALRAQKLAELLHWERELPSDSGQKASLTQCLNRVPAANRRALVEAYWRAREQVARYQVLADRAESLGALVPRALEQRKLAAGPGAMLRLEAARQAARSAVLDEHIRLLSAEFEVARLLGEPENRPWPLPSTAPHAGSYRVAPPRAQAPREPKLEHLGAVLVMLHAEIESQSKAVVFADDYRALVVGDGQRREVIIDMALAATEREARETQRFLQLLTRYNLAIADYVLATQPADGPASRFGEALIVERARSEG